MPKDENALQECRLLIGGEWVSGAETFPVKDKFTGETVAHAHEPSRAQVAEAVKSAKDAFEARPLGAQERYGLLSAAAGLLEKRREAFVQSITTDTGFTTSDAAGEVGRAVQTLTLSAEAHGRGGRGRGPPDALLGPGPRTRRAGLWRVESSDLYPRRHAKP